MLCVFFRSSRGKRFPQDRVFRFDGLGYRVMMNVSEDLIARGQRVMLGNYNPAPLVIARGQGCVVWDVEGREFLDLTAGVAVLSLGHAHPRLVRAVSEQVGKLSHVSNLFYNEAAIRLSERLVDAIGLPRVFFSNSGTEANEALLKLARHWHHLRGAPERVGFVCTDGAFHGRTFGSLSVTGQGKYHQGMGPLLGPIRRVQYNDLDAMERAITEDTAAVILEPIQGEGGIHVAAPGYLRGVRELCDRAGVLLLFDEVQTCFGRTGRFMAREWDEVWPDACSLAKGMGGGFPVGAIAVSARVADGLPPGSHASTFGGNPLACAASLAVLDVIRDQRLVTHAEECGRWFLERARPLIDGERLVDVRGRGLMLGLELGPGLDVGRCLNELRERGVLLTRAGSSVLRFVPPLVVTREQLGVGLDTTMEVLHGM